MTSLPVFTVVATGTVVVVTTWVLLAGTAPPLTTYSRPEVYSAGYELVVYCSA
jgi:hypothetical protein